MPKLILVIFGLFARANLEISVTLSGIERLVIAGLFEIESSESSVRPELRVSVLRLTAPTIAAPPTALVSVSRAYEVALLPEGYATRVVPSSVYTTPSTLLYVVFSSFTVIVSRLAQCAKAPLPR